MIMSRGNREKFMVYGLWLNVHWVMNRRGLKTYKVLKILKTSGVRNRFQKPYRPFSCKNIHDHEQHDDNGYDFDGGFYRMRIENIEHWNWCFVSGCKCEICAATAFSDLDGKRFFVGEGLY
jgi:hypothetical protein